MPFYFCLLMLLASFLIALFGSDDFMREPEECVIRFYDGTTANGSNCRPCYGGAFCDGVSYQGFKSVECRKAEK